MRALIVLALATSVVGCTRWSMDHLSLIHI